MAQLRHGPLVGASRSADTPDQESVNHNTVNHNTTNEDTTDQEVAERT